MNYDLQFIADRSRKAFIKKSLELIGQRIMITHFQILKISQKNKARKESFQNECCEFFAPDQILLFRLY